MSLIIILVVSVLLIFLFVVLAFFKPIPIF